MAGERYGLGINDPPRGKPSVRRAQKLITSEEGEFAAPVSLNADKRIGLLDDPYAEETFEDIAPQPEELFVFDDEPAWQQPIATVPVARRQMAAAPGAQGEPLQYSEARAKRPSHPRAPAKKSGQGGGKHQRKEPRGWKAYLYATLIMLSVICMCVLAVVMMPQMAGYLWTDFGNYAFVNGELLRYDKESSNLYKQYRSYMARDVIYPGVFVDGVHVGDMTLDEARTALTAAGSDVPNGFSVTVAIGDKTWVVDSSNVPAQRNLGNVLERAYAIGRTNTTAIQSTLQTPFRERLNRTIALRESGVNLTTQASYDHEAVRAIVQEIAQYVTRPPVDAQILSFDYKARTFTFSQEQPGVTLDQELLYGKLITALDRWEKGATVTADPVVTPPKVTKADLAANFKLVSAFTTDTTKDRNRNTNIDLACRAINGTHLLPGESFSFNATTGQRTTEKGYQSAGAIAAGQSIEEVGGGICQVSSTIFNAVARANLEIVSRSPHAWPSSYVNRGEDATVNWPNLDFKFKNNTNSPIFLITYYQDRKMSAEIWGMSLGEGVSIDLDSNVIKTMQPSGEVKYVLNTELPYGTEKNTVKARTGYVVETYKVWLLNGKEQKRELLHTSTYKAYQQVVEYNN
ncbi:MAG: VanW family protein [Clostridia bacterium]